MKENTLLSLGFKKEFDEDEPEMFWYVKNIKHTILNNLHIIVDQHLTVYFNEPNKRIGNLCNGSGQTVILFESENTLENYCFITNWLSN